ncbi:MAG: hypothetical protein FJX47_14875, partial [Alphaproteobacteria bacterium]|nr:hypothetical protein [Alphaproteobacteria bacterium]
MSDLIVNAVEPRVQYLADGAQTVFPFPFPVLEAGDLVARVDGAEPPVAPTLAGLGESAGGTATFATPPADGAVVTLWRAMPVRRLTDF